VVAKLFMFQCLELFHSVIIKLNIKLPAAIKYIQDSPQKVTVQNFVTLMLSIGYNPMKLQHNLRHIHHFFKGSEMPELEFMMVVNEAIGDHQ
jgi:hypothetical protein